MDDFTPMDVRHVGPTAGVKGLKAARGLVNRLADSVNGDRPPTAKKPDLLHEEREAAHMIRMFVRHNQRIQRVDIDAGRHHPLNHIPTTIDRKSTRLNSSHVAISYAVF